jgi:dephospho-CoA kinase
LEKGWQNQVDRVLVVDCPPNLQVKRLISRDGLLIDEIELIMKTQANRDARLAIANDVIYTDYDFSQLQKQVLALHQLYSECNYPKFNNLLSIG